MATPHTSLREFWRDAHPLPGAARLGAGVAAAANAGSYAGLAMRGEYAWLGTMHVVVMLLGLITVLRLGLHHYLAVRTFGTRVTAAPLPRGAVALTICALLYMLGVIVWLVVTHGEGGPELRDGREVWVLHGRVVRALPPGSIATFATHELRLFSASWLFFALVLAWTSLTVESRIRAYRASRRQVAA